METRKERSPEIKKIRLIHGAHSVTQADIWLVEAEGRACVLRDYSSPRSFLARALCRWAVRREIRAHRLLDGIEGIPKLVRVLDADRYLMDYIEGKPLSELFQNPPGEGFFASLTRLVAEMHERGVAHGDLRNKNILVGPGEQPSLVDFSTAWWRDPWWRRPLFRLFRLIDRRRLAKTIIKLAPGTLSEKEHASLERLPVFFRLGRLYRKRIYPWLRARRKDLDKGA